MTTMRDDEDLVRLLRATLAAQSATVDHGPAWSADLPPDRHSTRRWLVVAAAVAIVLIAAGLLVFADRSKSHHGQPATPKVCPTSLPVSWRSALTPLDRLGTDAAAWSANAAGTVVVSGKGRFSIITATSRTEPIPAATIPGVTAVATDGDSVVTLDAADPAHQSLRVYDISSGTSRTIAKTSDTAPGPNASVDIDKAFLQDGHVFYDVASTFGATGTIHDYDVALGKDTIAFRGDVRSFGSHPGYDVYWAGHQVPARISDAARRVLARVISDPNVHYVDSSGTYAWSDGDGMFRMSPDGTVIGPFRPEDIDDLAVQAVAGPYVLFTHPLHGRHVYVLDMATGAVAPTGLVVPAQLSVGGVAAGGAVFAVTTATGVHRVVTSGLPPLEC